MDEVLKFLESLPTDCGAVTCRLRPFAPDYAGSEVVVDHPGALQSAVVMSIPAIDRSHPDYCALRLATMALGGYFGSRLMTNLREDKGLTYGVTAGLYGYREGSAVMVSTQCDNRSVKSVVDETVNEIKKLADNPPEGEELNRLIQTASTGLASILDSPFNVINHIAAERLTGTPVDYFDRQQTAVASLSAETIGNCARRYLDPDKMLIAVVGDCSTMVK